MAPGKARGSAGLGQRFSLRRALTAVALIGLPALLALEFALAAWYRAHPPPDYRLLDPEITSLHFFLPADTGVFYTVRPHFHQRFLRHEFDVEIRTNDLGLREADDWSGRTPDVAFVGDSFTFGWGVQAEERYSARVAHAFPDLSVVSLSYANGHAPPFYLSYLQHHPALVPRRILVLGLFAFNDLDEDVRDARLEIDPVSGVISYADSAHYAVSDRGFLYDRHSPPPGRWSLANLSYATALGRTIRVLLDPPPPPRDRSAAPLGLDAGRLDATARQGLGWVEALATLMRQRGGTLLVLYIPGGARVGDYRAQCPYRRAGCRRLRQNNALGERLATWAAERGIPFIDPVPDFRTREARGERLYYPRDGHWTPAGHEAAAALIARWLVDAGF